MTTTQPHDDRRERALGHIATLMAILRPGWDIAGCVAALRRLPDTMPIVGIVVAAMRYASDDTNKTPAHIADLGNRAWDNFDPWPCAIHPRAKRRSATGECADCWVDANADETATATFVRRSPPDEARELAGRTTSERATEDAS